MDHLDLIMGVIVPYTNFAIFLFALFYFARKPLANMAAQKADDFQKQLQEALQAKEDAEAKLKVLQDRMSKIDDEISGIRSTSEKSAKAEAEKIVSEAKTLAEHLKDEAKRTADAEVDAAIASLRKEIVTLVRQGVQEKVAKEVTPDKHQALIKTKIGGLKQASIALS